MIADGDSAATSPGCGEACSSRGCASATAGPVPNRAPSTTAAPSRARRDLTTAPTAYVFFGGQRVMLRVRVTVLPPDALVFVVILNLLAFTFLRLSSTLQRPVF